MLDTPITAFTAIESWHPSGWSPVYDAVSSPRHLVGFTTLQCGIDRFMMTEAAGDEGDAIAILGHARVALAGEYNGWVVEIGDYRDLPGFWEL